MKPATFDGLTDVCNQRCAILLDLRARLLIRPKVRDAHACIVLSAMAAALPGFKWLLSMARSIQRYDLRTRYMVHIYTQHVLNAAGEHIHALAGSNASANQALYVLEVPEPQPVSCANQIVP